MGNIHLKLYEIWTSGLGGDVVLLFCSANPFQLQNLEKKV